MSLQSILEEHTGLCEQAYQLILDENYLLKRDGHLPDESFLAKKRRFLSSFSESLSALRERQPEFISDLPKCRIMIEKAQQIILKTLLVDRENEQFLLKCTMTARPLPAVPRVSASHLQKLYRRNN